METAQQYGYSGQTADFGSDHVLLLLPVRDGQEVEDTVFADIGQQIMNWLQIPVFLAVSETIPYEGNISAVYKQTVDCSMLKFLTGTNKIYRKSDYATYMKQVSDAIIPGELLQSLIRAVNVRNAQAMTIGLAEIFAKLKELPYHQCTQELTHVRYELVAFSNGLPTGSA